MKTRLFQNAAGLVLTVLIFSALHRMEEGG